jgi:DNA ligase-1
MHKLYPMLYKRTTKGKIQTWQGEIDNGRYRSFAGYTDGKRTVSEWSQAPDMNVGKANERLSPAQAEFIMDSTYTKKLKGAYHTSLDAIDKDRFFVPMTAKKWKDWNEKVDRNQTFYVQPKLDGMRCICDKNGLWSRNGEQWVSVPHIHEIMMELYGHLFEANPDLKFDGELYNHQFRDNFDKIASILRKTKPTEEDLAESRQYVQYWIYDIASMGKAGFSARLDSLQKNWVDHPSMVLTPTETVGFDEIDERATRWIEEDGYEGGMVRLDMAYTSKRSDSLFKWKRVEDAEFEIVDIEPGRGGHAHIAARVIQKTADGQIFAAGILGDHEYCKKLLENKADIIGKMGTTEFQNLTPGGIPRFGKFKVVRDYE